MEAGLHFQDAVVLLSIWSATGRLELPVEEMMQSRGHRMRPISSAWKTFQPSLVLVLVLVRVQAL